MDLESSRLFMEPISLEEGQMLIKNPMAFYFQRGIPYEIAWPSYRLKAVLPIYVERLVNDNEEIGYGPWFIKDKHQGGFLVGSAGFNGKPDAQGMVEIECDLLDKYKEKNYDAEVLDTLCQWAFRQGVKLIRASCPAENTSYQFLLKENGFKKISNDRGMLVYERKSVKTSHYQESFYE